jgi:hypothetical protein
MCFCHNYRGIYMVVSLYLGWYVITAVTMRTRCSQMTWQLYSQDAIVDAPLALTMHNASKGHL